VAHPNEAVIRRMFDEFGQPDMVREVFAPDAVWEEPGSSPISGKYTGRDAILGLFGEVLGRSGDTFRVVDVVDILANDRHGVAFVLVEGEHAGRLIRTTDAVVYRLRDGRIVEGRVLSEDQREVDAFWEDV
jgi:ketosteroid isomerase-like protein